MQPLIAELADLILKDNAILFVGSNVGAGDSRVPLVQQMADALAARIDYQRADRSLPAVARDFEVLQGRSALILALREDLARLQIGPDPIQHLVADAVLPTTKLITTRFDQMLESALTQFEKSYVLIVRDTDAPFFDESKVTIIKIQGDINQPDSLIITEDDVDAFINNLPTLSDILRAFFATKTLIFLGYDLNSSQFKRFFSQVTRNLSIYRRTAYAIVPPDAEGMDAVGQRYWKNQNVDILLRDPMLFLDELAQAVKTGSATVAARPRAATTEPPLPLPAQPYKGLQPFAADDAPLFAGRDQESSQLLNRVLANRLTIVYGESGVGKSSLLHAGFAPRLHVQRGLLAVALPAADRPVTTSLHESLLVAARKAGLPPESSSEDIRATIRAVQRLLDGPVVLALDQAEQFFLVYTAEEQAAALAQLQALVADRSLNLRIVIVIREDALGRLHPLEAILPDVLHVRYRVEPLRREAAREAIEKPASLYGVRWEAALVQRLLVDLSDPDSGNIGPAQLQINCQRLYREAVARSPSPPPTITLALFEALGNTITLLGDFLTESIHALAPEQQPAARNFLGALVSSSGVKQRLSLADLARFVELPPSDAGAILDALVEGSLVRRVVRPGAQSGAEFELSHDSLIPRVVSWLGDDFWAVQKVREILRMAAPEWTKRARLLPADDLRLASQRRSQLRVTPVEAALLYASAVAYDLAVADWQPATAADERYTLLGLLTHPDEQTRQHAALRLARFPDPESAQGLGQLALTDPTPTVRDAAIRGLAAQIQASGPEIAGAGVRAIVAGLDQPATQTSALHSLVTLRDLAPAIHPLLPTERRVPIQRQVWLTRWQRHFPQILRRTIQGVQGGFCGLGLGIGLFLGLNIFIADGFTLALLLQRLDSILFGVSAGIPIMGLIGGAAGGAAALGGGVARFLPDRPAPQRIWLAQIGVCAGAMGLGWLVFAFVMPGDARVWQTLLAGLLLGGLLAAGAGIPFVRQPIPRLAVSLAAGVLAFVLLSLLSLIFNAIFWWLLVMGLVGGAGFFWAFGEDALATADH